MRIVNVEQQPSHLEETMSGFRTEKDSMGTMQVPASALYGAQTARALDNFPVSGTSMPAAFLKTLGMIKQHAARVNRELGLLDSALALAIMDAAEEVVTGELLEHFPIDVYQTGSGTSSNMNANEVIANRAAQLLERKLGDKSVHPNDHVNLGQSSNDVIPTALHIAAATELQHQLLPALNALQQQLAAKAGEFDAIIKIGRTHLQDATPIRLGQVFSGYARQVELAIQRLTAAQTGLFELPLGGTAVGTGINTHPRFAEGVIAGISEVTGLPFREAQNHFEAQASKDAVVTVSGALKGAAVALFKLANDIRFLASGPRCGIGELQLPAVQPGSSIMPGKVNPVMAESLIQVCAQVIGADAAITIGGLAGNFELNVMMPMMTHNLLQAIALLGNAVRLFSDRCVSGLQANRERCAELVEQSLAMVTILAPVIGYDRAADLAKQASMSGKTIRETVREAKLLSEEELERILDPRPMTEPGLGNT
jgi:fumarate hydratase class II